VAISASQLDDHLARADALRPVYLIAGEEPLLLLEAADALRRRARALGYSERDVLDVESGFDWNDLARAGASMSLFASRRIIELRLPTGKAGTEGSTAITEYCDSAPPDVVLIIHAMQWSKAHEAKWVQSVEKAGVFVQIKPVYREELVGWIGARARSREVQLTPDAVQLLADRIEGNLLAAAQEIDKLVLLAPGQRIDADALLELVADSARYNVFAMVDAALAGDSVRVRRVLAGLKAEGEQVAGLCGWLVTSLNVVLRLAAVPRHQLDNQMKNERLFGARQNAFKRALARGDRSFWEQRLAEVAFVDRVSKGRAGGDAFLALERTLLRMADQGAAQGMATGSP
jgi:DNA polymerase III subunit delta